MVTNCLRKTGVLLAVVALLAACAVQTGIRSAANAEVLVAQSGAPKLKLPLPAGGERWFYPSGPVGQETWRLDIAPGGAVVAREQVLTDAMFQDIRAGQSAAEVLMSIGPGYRKVRFERTRTTSWDYFYRDTWGYDADFCVIFNDAGIVTSKLTIRRDPADKDP